MMLQLIQGTLLLGIITEWGIHNSHETVLPVHLAAIYVSHKNKILVDDIEVYIMVYWGWNLRDSTSRNPFQCPLGWLSGNCQLETIVVRVGKGRDSTTRFHLGERGNEKEVSKPSSNYPEHLLKIRDCMSRRVAMEPVMSDQYPFSYQ